MDTHHASPARGRQHPLLIAAAIAVILFCAIGTAAIMGWLPASKGGSRGQLTDADRAALSAGLQQPGQPGYAAPSALPPGAAPALPLAAQPQAAPAYPAQAPAPATYPAPAAAAAAQAYAAPGTAYGGSGSLGSTGSGADYAPAASPAPQYAPAYPVQAPAPKAKHRAAQVAEADTHSNWCGNCGNVESIHQIRTRAQGSGVGAAGGAILGGLLGNQLGGGHGRQLATVAGAVGGAVVGNQVEGNMKADTSYEIRVRLDDGTLRTFHQQSAPQWRTGERVRIVKGTLRAA